MYLPIAVGFLSQMLLMLDWILSSFVNNCPSHCCVALELVDKRPNIHSAQNTQMERCRIVL